MEKKLNYFGTDLYTAGHYFFELVNDYFGRSDIRFEGLPFDPENLISKHEKRNKGDVDFFSINGYSILRIEGSCKDDRWGTKSVFFVQDNLSETEISDKIKSTPVAMKIIKQMPFGVPYFQHSKQ